MGRWFSPRGCEEIGGCRSKSGHDTGLFPAGNRAPGSLQGTRRPARQDDDLQHLGGIILVLRCNFLLGGGDMIKVVTFEKTTYADLPYKFEAGTPNIAGGIGLGAALAYVNQLGIDRIAAYEHA